MYIINPIYKNKILLIKDNLETCRKIIKQYIIHYLSDDLPKYQTRHNTEKINIDPEIDTTQLNLHNIVTPKRLKKSKTKKNWWDNKQSWWKNIFKD